MKLQVKLNTSASAACEGRLDGGLLPFFPSARALKCCRGRNALVQWLDSREGAYRRASENASHFCCLSCGLSSRPNFGTKSILGLLWTAKLNVVCLPAHQRLLV